MIYVCLIIYIHFSCRNVIFSNNNDNNDMFNYLFTACLFICLYVFIAENAAKDYIKKMAFFFPPDRLPRFDCLLLGLGPDGHTCSLFPGHRALDDENMWVTWELNSPKPPSSRISLAMPVINNARMCVFIATGASKAEIVEVIKKTFLLYQMIM